MLSIPSRFLPPYLGKPSQDQLERWLRDFEMDGWQMAIVKVYRHQAEDHKAETRDRESCTSAQWSSVKLLFCDVNSRSPALAGKGAAKPSAVTRDEPIVRRPYHIVRVWRQAPLAPIHLHCAGLTDCC